LIEKMVTNGPLNLMYDFCQTFVELDSKEDRMHLSIQRRRDIILSPFREKKTML
jgi:hypothetical protein